jgi:TolB-like protein
VAYAIVAWLLVEVASVIMPALHLPDWALTLLVVFVVAGFPLALILAWAFELTPEGIKRDADVDRESLITRQTSRKLDFAIIGLLAIALIFVVVDNYVLEAEPEESPGGAPPSIRSLAVLPLENLSGQKEQEYFTVGMTEAVISQLAKIASLSVVSRTSVMQYTGVRMPMGEIASKLGVDAVVEGSVLRADDVVRITVQLIDARNDRHLWAESYERNLRDVLALQGEVARAIAREIQLVLSPTDRERLAIARPVNPEAYEAFLKGRYLQEQQGALNHVRAVELLERAVALDPEYAPAWTALANGYT